MDNLRLLRRRAACTPSSGRPASTLARLDEVRALLADGRRVGVLVAPNFALGAVLLMRFAAQAAPYYESVEVVELHHPDKLDAPSGTARRTAELIAAARATAGLGAVPDATSTGARRRTRRPVDGVAVHSVRLRGLVAHQEVLLRRPRGDADACGTTRWTGRRSCRACCSASARSRHGPASPSAWSSLLGLA